MDDTQLMSTEQLRRTLAEAEANYTAAATAMSLGGVRLAQARALLDGLETPTQPVPLRDGRPLASGPIVLPGSVYTGKQMFRSWNGADGIPYGSQWDAITRPQPSEDVPHETQAEAGYCNIKAVAADRLRFTLTRKDHPDHAATTEWQQHLRWPDPVDGAAYEFTVQKVTTERFLTMKFGGLVGFDENWDEWPGGGRFGPANFMARVVANAGWGKPSWSLLLSWGKQHQDITVTGTDDPAIRVIKDGWGVEVVARNGPEFRNGHDYRVRMEVLAGRPNEPVGSVRLFVDDDHVMTLSDIIWATEGNAQLNRAYLLAVYGGTSEKFAPQNPEQTGILEISNVRCSELNAA